MASIAQATRQLHDVGVRPGMVLLVHPSFSRVAPIVEGPGGQNPGAARLARSRDVVDVVVRRLRDDPKVFLHPPGTDAQCDDAWRSLRLL